MRSLKTQVTTTRLAETKRFYEEVLGMVVVEEWDSPGDRGVILGFASGTNEALLEIYGGDQASTFDALTLQFRVPDLDAYLSGLPSGVSYEGPTPRPWGSTYAYLQDPNGIEIIVYSGRW